MSKQFKQVILLVIVVGIAMTLLSRGGADNSSEAKKTAATRTVRGKGDRGKLDEKDIPVVVRASPGMLPGEVFLRERNLFATARAPEELEAERIMTEQLARKRDQEAAAQRQRDAEQARIRDEQAARDAKVRADAARLLAEQIRNNPPPLVPPQFPHAFIGHIGPADDGYAILLGSDGKFIYAKRGDVVDGSFKIESVWLERLDLTFTDARFQGLVAQVPRSHESESPRVR